MKSNLTKQKSIYAKQSSNELALQTPTHQSITLYNAENSEFLSEKCISLQGLLLNIAEVDYLIETATLCLPAIQDLLNTSRALIEDISRNIDPDLWPTYAGMFGELATQIQAVIAEASYKNRNLLCGDTITLKFNEDESYNFTITGKNLGVTVEVLNGLVTSRPVSQKRLRQIKQKLEENNSSIKALNVILESTAAVIRSKKMFTQKLLHRFTTRLNAMKYENDEMAQLSHRSVPSLTSRLQEAETSPFEGAPNLSAPEQPAQHPPVLGYENSEAASVEPSGGEPFLADLAENKTPVQSKKNRSEGGLISLFPLFRSKKNKDNEPQGIRTILNRLKNTEVDLDENMPVPEPAEQKTETSPDESDSSREYLNQVCMEILVQLKNDAVPQLQALAAAGKDAVYADHLSRIIAKEKLHIELLVRENADMMRILQKFEQAFHLLVKEQYHQAPEKTETYIRDWLNSNYGSIYKIVFSILRNTPKNQS